MLTIVRFAYKCLSLNQQRVSAHESLVNMLTGSACASAYIFGTILVWIHVYYVSSDAYIHTYIHARRSSLLVRDHTYIYLNARASSPELSCSRLKAHIWQTHTALDGSSILRRNLHDCTIWIYLQIHAHLYSGILCYIIHVSHADGYSLVGKISQPIFIEGSAPHLVSQYV